MYCLLKEKQIFVKKLRDPDYDSTEFVNAKKAVVKTRTEV